MSTPQLTHSRQAENAMSMQQQLQQRVTRLRGQTGQTGQTARLARQPDVGLQTDGPSPAALGRQLLLLGRRRYRRVVRVNDLGMLDVLENRGPAQTGIGSSGLGLIHQADIQLRRASAAGWRMPVLRRQSRGQGWREAAARLPTWEHPDQLQVQTCAICSEQIQVGDSITGLPCLHTFHSACITPWFEQKDTCPCCRHSIRHNQIGPADPQHAESPRAFALGELWLAMDLSAENDLQQEFNRSVAELGTLAV